MRHACRRITPDSGQLNSKTIIMEQALLLNRVSCIALHDDWAMLHSKLTAETGLLGEWSQNEIIYCLHDVVY